MSDKSDHFEQYSLFKKSLALSLAVVILSSSSLSSAANHSRYSDAKVTEYAYDDAGSIERYDDGSYAQGTDEGAVDRGYGSSTGEDDYIDSNDESFEYDATSDAAKDVKEAARDARDAASDDSEDASYDED